MATGEKRHAFPQTAPSLTVLLPALNERDNLEPTVDQVRRALAVAVEDFEILIVDDGSTDDTGAIADRLAARYPEVRAVHNPRNMGIGYSYLRGIELASKDSFVFIPADNTWPFRSLAELFGTMGSAEVVTSYFTNPEVRPLGRRTVSKWYTRTLNLLFGRRLHYYNGLTIYPIAFLRTQPVTTYGFGFQAEALLRALARGFSFVEVPLTIEERTAGGSKAVRIKNIVSVVATVARLLWDLRVAGGGPQGSGTSARSSPRTGFPRAASVTPPGSGAGPAEPLRILITGASTGIGAGLMEALAADGHMLFACARRPDVLDRATRRSTLARGRACDVSDEDQVREFITWVRSQTPYLDALIHCAGVIGAIGPAASADSRAWWETLRVNLFGAYLMATHALPLLAESRDPRILFFSGGGAFGVRPNYSAYACSKAGVVRLTENLAAELAPQGIAVNAVAPGFVATEHHRPTLEAGPERAGLLAYRRTSVLLEDGAQRAAAQIGAVADCVRMLLSPETRGLTGKTISANFDPWRTTVFREHIEAITRSDLYAMRRINIVNLPEGALKRALAGAAGGRR